MSGPWQCYYFNARGRAEICRLSFAAANIELEDKINVWMASDGPRKKHVSRKAYEIDDCKRFGNFEKTEIPRWL